LLEKLRSGKTVFGCWVSIGHPEIPEMLSVLDFDFFIFEMEHTPITLNVLESLLQTTSEKVTPIVRVPNDHYYIEQALDMGAQGIMVPRVDNGADIAKAVKAAKFPPEGERGSGFRRASEYSTRRAEYFKEANSETMIIALIESIEGVRHAKEIISTKGVDAWWVGPGDLSASLGRIGEVDAPEVQAAIDTVVKTGQGLGIPGAKSAHSVEDVRAYTRKGYRMMTLGHDYSFLIDNAKSILGNARNAIQPS
jgi:2-dehydro-3-deoxyglucarate aldolase